MQTLTKNKYLSDADFEKFKRVIEEMLEENPNDPTLIELARNVSANQDANESEPIE